MMYSFILLSLVVAVYCHQPVPELYDADKYEAKVKRLDEVEELIDRVTTRIQNLKDKRELRQKQKDDADRRSKSILLRLDRMKLNDGSFHCDKPDKEFKCRKNTQCVNNILVCDNVPDCEDKSDEDPDLCKIPYQEGTMWHGYNAKWDCSMTESSVGRLRVSIDIEEITTYPYSPSMNKIQTRFYWTFGDTAIRTLPLSGTYYYATDTFITEFIYGGNVMVGNIRTFANGKVAVIDFYRYGSQTMCGQTIFLKDAEFIIGKAFS